MPHPFKTRAVKLTKVKKQNHNIPTLVVIIVSPTLSCTQCTYTRTAFLAGHVFYKFPSVFLAFVVTVAVVAVTIVILLFTWEYAIVNCKRTVLLPNHLRPSRSIIDLWVSSHDDASLVCEVPLQVLLQ